jgi:hypothetical protein
MTAKKAAKKAPAKRSAKPAAKKSAPKKQPASSMAPKPVNTGKGAAPADVAREFIALIRAGKANEAEKTWLAPGIESVEGFGASMAWRGKKAVQAKYRAWEADHEVHRMSVDGPWIGATGVALRVHVDATQLSTGQRMEMEVIAVYTVRDGKVVREEFHFALPT